MYILAIITFVKHPDDTPVKKGVYRITRNPQQIFLIIMWSSIGLILGNFLFPILGLAEMLLSYPGIRVQENFCIKKFGKSYRNYMQTTPRYLFF